MNDDARARLRLTFAPAQAVTAIHGARIVIVAIDRFSNANTFFAMVPDGASVPIEAFTFRKDLVGTTIRTRAAINGAIVAVVTGSVVGHTVAIVVDTVAYLFGRFARRTGAETGLFTDPHARACTKIVGHLAGGR